MPRPRVDPRRTAAAGAPERSRGRRWFGILALALGAGALVLVARERSGPVTFPAAPVGSPRAVQRADFVGAERCAGCHRQEYDRWRASTHGRAGGAASSERVIASFDGRPFHFADARVTPRRSGGSYQFLVEQEGVPAEIWTVDAVVGGGHLVGGGTQGFVTRRPDGTLRFLPFDWSRQARVWFCNTGGRAGRGWVPVNPELRLADCADWPPARILGDLPQFSNCQSCHASQLVVERDSATGRLGTGFTALDVNCEACHGPGRRHVDAVGRGESDPGYRPLAALDKDASLGICFQCHAIKSRLRTGFISGESLATYYSLAFSALGDRPLHPDGRVRTFAYQEGHRFSACYLDGGMTCTSCHEPHGQDYQDQFGRPLAGRFDDGQCTACHPSKGTGPAQHSRHRADGPVGCVACHMPYLQQPETGTQVPYARSDHTIAVPRPSLDSALGLRNACLGCHGDRTIAALEQQIRIWYGEPKPLHPAVAAQLAFREGLPLMEAMPLLLGTGPDSVADRHAAARFAGLARFVEAYLRPDQEVPPPVRRRLQALAAHPDPDVRALALAGLHLALGSDRGVRGRLARTLAASDAGADGVRDRWALALGYLGDRLAGMGRTADAIVAYRRALEVTARPAPIWLQLANAAREGGDLPTALAAYRAAEAADATVPLLFANYGVALARTGDTARAVAILERAIAREPENPLGYFNLANIAYQRGDGPRARQLYLAAVERDPGLAPAYFQLARLALLAGDAAAALGHLRRGLAFDPGNAAARASAEELARVVGGR